MCSIIAYVGGSDAAPVLVSGLRRMEYRGYDSVGVATLRDDGAMLLKKGAGRVDEVNRRLGMDALSGSTGLGHTRWATHGSVNDANAHPHVSGTGGVAIVHNGVIENHAELRRSLEGEGYAFASETDSEVIANLLQRHYDRAGDERSALLGTVSEIRGHYAFIALFGNGAMVCARYGEPLIAGLADDGLFLSSDVRGFIEHTDDAVYLENGVCGVVRGGALEAMDFEGNAVRHATTRVSKEFGDLDKGEHAHYTLKEINEQPGVIRRAGASSVRQIREAAALIREAGHAYATGSGTSYNAALMARRALARFAGIRLETAISSEASGELMLERGGVFLAISQSGESADVLEAAKDARKAGCTIVGVVNSANSSLARDSDMVIRIDCGAEVGVAATKSFCAQYCVMLRLAEEMAGDTGLNLEGVGRRGGRRHRRFRQHPGGGLPHPGHNQHLRPRQGAALPRRHGGGPQDKGAHLHTRRGAGRRRDEARPAGPNREGQLRHSDEPVRLHVRRHAAGGAGGPGEGRAHHRDIRPPQRRVRPLDTDTARPRGLLLVLGGCGGAAAGVPRGGGPGHGSGLSPKPGKVGHREVTCRAPCGGRCNRRTGAPRRAAFGGSRSGTAPDGPSTR